MLRRVAMVPLEVMDPHAAKGFLVDMVPRKAMVTVVVVGLVTMDLLVDLGILVMTDISVAVGN